MTEDLEYQELIKADVMDRMSEFDEYVQFVLDKPRKLTFGDTELIYEGSPVISSTAIGYAIEAVVERSGITDKVGKDVKKPTNQSCYDFIQETEDSIVVINIKSKRRDSTDSGVCAYSNLMDCLEHHGRDKPVFYYVYTVEYDIDIETQEVAFVSFDYYCLNNVLMEPVGTDSRAWSKTSKRLSGRIQIKSGNSRLKTIVPTFNEFKCRIEEIRNLESQGRLISNYFYDKPCDPNVKRTKRTYKKKG